MDSSEFDEPGAKPERLDLEVEWEPFLTEAEIVQRIQEPGGSTLAEFWARIGTGGADLR